MELAPPPAPITHVALTVSDLDRSIEWYTKLFGDPPAYQQEFLTGTPDAYRAAIWRVPNLGLHHFEDRAEGAFDARRPGLDHVAFACADLDAVQTWLAHVEALGFDHGDILEESYGIGLAVFDPDGIALEFFASTRAPG
jgi:glyoxylase I family protein